MTSRLKNSAGPTSLAASIRMSRRGVVGGGALQMLVGVLDHDDGRVHHGAYGDGDAAEAHDVGAETQGLHRRESHEHADRQHDDGDQGAAHMQQEDHADQRDDDAFLGQRAVSASRWRRG